MSLAKNPAAKLWLAQFKSSEPLAGRLLEKFLFVSGAQFSDNLSTKALGLFPTNEVAAFFIERKLQTTRSGLPRKMYKEEKILLARGMPKRFRAEGAALPAVESSTNNLQDIGSEGIVASVITQLSRQHKKRFLVHPSTNEIRKRRVSHFVIVTDFIGSGTRTLRMLESLWQLRSVRSWYNGGKIKFSVLSYSGTSIGKRRVRAHKTKPIISMVCSCPTLVNSFKGTERDAIIDLCINWSPDVVEPLGYKDTGALIAFEHSCPNNVPAIFYKANDSRRNPWHPLFPSRVATGIARAQPYLTEIEMDSAALEALKYPLIAASDVFQRSNSERRRVVVVLAAFSRGYRATDSLATVTGRRLWELSSSISRAQEEKLLESNLRLTEQGFALLRSTNTPNLTKKMAVVPKKYYYPSSLRMPT